MEARRDWKKYVRETLKHNRRGLDTELQVWNECRTLSNVGEWQRWKDVKDEFKPNSVPVWIDDFAIRAARVWLEQEEGICWTEHTAFGKRLSEISGHKYYGAGDDSILDASGPIIASIRSHGTGKNLQQWSKNLIVSLPPNGSTIEQLLGRTHRPGQSQDEVTNMIWLHTQELNNGLEKAFADARYLQESTGNRQKLLYADVI